MIVGEEVKTAEGDLICVFLETAILPGMSAVETIAAAREQGALVGIPHPFDRMRGSLLRDAAMASLAPHVDWVEAHNARVVGHGNEEAAAVRDRPGLPGIAVSDAHSIMEIGVAYSRSRAIRRRPAGLLAALAGGRGRARSRELLRPALDAGRQGRQTGARQRSRPARAPTAPPGSAVARDRQDGQDHRPMADGTDGPVGSGAMEATPAVDPAFGHHHDPESLVEALEMEPTESRRSRSRGG